MQATIPRWLLLGALVVGLFSAVRLGWVVRDYTGAIRTLQGIDFEIVGVTRAGDELILEIDISNDSDSPVEAQSLHLNVYGSDPGPLGATYTPLELTRVEGNTTTRIERVARINHPERLDALDTTQTPLRFRGQALLRLTVSDRYFRQDLSLSWQGEP